MTGIRLKVVAAAGAAVALLLLEAPALLQEGVSAGHAAAAVAMAGPDQAASAVPIPPQPRAGDAGGGAPAMRDVYSDGGYWYWLEHVEYMP